MADFSSSCNLDSVSVRDHSKDIENDDDGEVRIILVGQRCKNNAALDTALKSYDVPVLYSDTGLEYSNETEEYDTIFVLDNFGGDIYHKLHRSGVRIMGPAAIIKAAQNNERIPYNSRPLYTTSMQGLVLCFTGFKVKEELSRLADLVHHMGGSIRKDFSLRVTHLVANCTGGEKYRVAVSMGTPIMSEDWVHQCWEHREDTDQLATGPHLMQFRMSPFSYTCLSFLGFSREEQRHMEDIAAENGGACAEAGAPTCTHLVVDEQTVRQIPFETHPRLHIVKAEWFWASIQMDACADESMYRFEHPSGTPSPLAGKKTPQTLSGNKTRKRKRLRDNLAQLAQEGDMDTPIHVSKRKSNEVALMSFSGSFLDATNDTSADIFADNTVRDINIKSPPPPAPVAKISARQQVVMELLQTERSYVDILQVILKTFKGEIEKTDQPGGPIISATDLKLIFGKLPPIYEVHTKIRDELADIISNWQEQCSIAPVILQHADELQKAYPPFINFFENTKETINKCDRTVPRFHAFLKVCQSRPECGRQSLTELMIRPVQRLPSIMLLLKDILKRTDRSNEDYTLLEQAISTLEEVMTHINEDKRKTEGQVVMFDIVNDIDNCPPNLLSSHRKFVTRVDVVELTDTLSGRGDNISLFLFSDSLEMCKRRVKVLNSKSPATTGSKTPQKAYKHIEMLPLSSIKRVVDIFESSECKNVFALITKKVEEKEKLYAFVLIDEDCNKSEFLKTLCKHICNTTCRANYENLITSLEASVLGIDVADMTNRSISKAATRFGKRVSRAFSFNKTPRRLKRAMSSVSQVMSPFRRDSVYLHPNASNTPRGDLRAMRLASTNDLTDFSYTDIVDHAVSPEKKHRLSVALSDMESPISAIPITPRPKALTAHLSKSATVGHAASNKFL